MSNRPRRARRPTTAVPADAFSQTVLAKAALLVIHRVARSMVAPATDTKAFQRQQEAMTQLVQFADTHPLSPDMEKML